jgi:hypothetical protein
MKREQLNRSLALLIAGLVLVLACGFFGAAIGLLGAKLLSPPGGMGWDRIADMLGGLMLGAGLGVGAGLYLTVGLSARARWWSAVVAVVLGLGILFSLALTAPQRQAQATPGIEQDRN